MTCNKVASYSNGGDSTSRRSGNISAILPSSGGRIAIRVLGEYSFRRRLIDGNGMDTHKRTSLHFRAGRIVTRICIGGNSHIHGKRGLTRLSGFHLRRGLSRTRSTLLGTRLRLGSMLVKRKCAPSSFDGMPRRAVGLTGMGDNCRRSGSRCRLAGERARRTALITPFSKVMTGLFSGPCGLTGASRTFYAIVSAHKVRASFAILRGRLTFVGANSGMVVAPCTNKNSCRNDMSRVGPLISTGKVMGMGTTMGKRKGLFDNVGMEMDIGQDLKRRLIVPGATIILHSNGRIIFALGRNGTV